MVFPSLLSLKLFAIGFVCMVAIDFVWLKFVMGPVFSQHMGHLMRADAIVIPAILTWVVMTISLLIFVHGTPVYSDTLLHAVMYGAILGGCTYAVYDLTNYATLTGWSWRVMLIDIAWGMILSGLVSAIIRWSK